MKFNEPSLKSFRVSDSIVESLKRCKQGVMLSKTTLARTAFNIGYSEAIKGKTKRAQCMAAHQIDMRDGISSVANFRITKKQEKRISKLNCIDIVGYSSVCRLCLLIGLSELNHRKSNLNKKEFIAYVLTNSFDEV